jgi:hypothetical protein
MRRIVIAQNETIDFNEIDDKSFVGIQWEGGSKCMIIRTPEGFCSISNVYRPNTMHVWYTNTVQEYVSRALNQGNNTNSRAFAFNNAKELYEWMSI